MVFTLSSLAAKDDRVHFLHGTQVLPLILPRS